MRAAVSLVVVALAVCLAAALAPMAGGTSSTRCPPRGAVVLLRGAKVVVFHARTRGDNISACLRATGRRRALESKGEGIFARKPFARAGEFVAYPTEDISDATQGTFVFVGSVNVRTGKKNVAYAYSGNNGDVDADTATVTGVKVSSRGSTAWIACQTCNNHPTGDDARVYIYDIHSRFPTIVARGADIDGGSLAYHGTTLSWVQGGTRRSVAFR